MSKQLTLGGQSVVQLLLKPELEAGEHIWKLPRRDKRSVRSQVIAAIAAYPLLELSLLRHVVKTPEALDDAINWRKLMCEVRKRRGVC